ncbi:hypothetical protein GBAR_LOCUS28038 [Geodia barretti]|uniref:Endonuclease/exonuclease/phosphatase domain-containing protein n=1 Tax=Geodia barretti TaxID=519541 RepID=A0AA35XHN5_GEOBA|nr:hypothetical protein GBAR_LOCUS28038 [Geodia barretti]
MKLLTFNMCVEVGSVAERLEALGELVRDKRPEYIALQGVTNDTLKTIKTSGWAARYPHITQPPTRFETRTKATVAILSTYPAVKSITINYHDSPGKKKAVVGFFSMYDKQKVEHYICVVSTMLDPGLDLSLIREQEINELMYELRDHDDCFLLADMGLIAGVDGSLELSGGWKDAWLACGKSPKDGHTVDPDSNSLIKSGQRDRPDRILYRTQRYQLDSTEVVGTAKFKGTFISPHFGVLSVFSPLDTILPDHPVTDLPCSFLRPRNSLH